MVDQQLSVIFEDREVVNPNCFRIIDVEKDCELTTLMSEEKIPYVVGSVYYEFSRKHEQISTDKIIIFQDKVYD